MRRTPKDAVLVIRRSYNSNQDYFLPRDYAERAFNEGKLGQVQVGNGRWVYEDPNGRHLAHAI